MIKILRKLQIDVNLFSLLRNIYKSLIENMLNGEKADTFFLRLGVRHDAPSPITPP